MWGPSRVEVPGQVPVLDLGVAMELETLQPKSPDDPHRIVLPTCTERGHVYGSVTPPIGWGL